MGFDGPPHSVGSPFDNGLVCIVHNFPPPLKNGPPCLCRGSRWVPHPFLSGAIHPVNPVHPHLQRMTKITSRGCRFVHSLSRHFSPPPEPSSRTSQKVSSTSRCVCYWPTPSFFHSFGGVFFVFSLAGMAWLAVIVLA